MEFQSSSQEETQTYRAYLEHCFEYTRLLALRLAHRLPSPPPTSNPSPLGSIFAQAGLHDFTPPPHTPEPQDNSDTLIERNRAAYLSLLQHHLGGDTTFVFEDVRASFALTQEDMDLLQTICSAYLCTKTHAALLLLQNIPNEPRLRASFLADLISPTERHTHIALERLAPDAPLVRWGFLRLAPDARFTHNTPLGFSLVEVQPSFLEAVRRGLLPKPSTPCTVHRADLDLSVDDLTLSPHLIRDISTLLRKPKARIALLAPRHSGRCSLLRALSSSEARTVVEICLDDLFETDAETLRTFMRQTVLLGATLVLRLRVSDPVELKDAPLDTFKQWIALCPARVVLLATPTHETTARTLLHEPDLYQWPSLSNTHAQTLWTNQLQSILPYLQAQAAAEKLTTFYQLPSGSIVAACDHVLKNIRFTSSRSPKTSDVLHLVRNHVQTHHTTGMGWLADLITSHVSIDQIVLSPETMRELEHVLAYARNREKVFLTWGLGQTSHAGQGLSVLFEGPPGTGKTMCASFLASELGKSLYRVDLSRVVDKYIGETEKNLSRIFDIAERSQAVLLFDEADSLFAKRTSVKSSNDRYANLEVNFLLQRLESFSGVAVLTTNLASSLDDAFQRRIRFKLSFNVPDAHSRARLWQKLLPKKVPKAHDIDYNRLGKEFPFSGGHVRNAVIRACVDAAQADEAVNMDMLWRAARRESRDLGSLVRDKTNQK